jgi:hypothetical protein
MPAFEAVSQLTGADGLNVIFDKIYSQAPISDFLMASEAISSGL